MADRFYIRLRYLKAVHYIFYTLGVFSLTVAITLWNDYASGSFVFACLSAVHMSGSMLLAYFFYKDYTKELAASSILKSYGLPYFAISITTVLVTEALFIVIPGFSQMMYYMLFANYYYVFIMVIAATLYKVKPVHRLFRMQDRKALEDAKSIALKRSGMKEIGEYRVGTDPVVDQVLDDIHADRGSAANIKKLELEVCLNKVREIGSWIREAKMRGESPYKIKQLEEKKREYDEKARSI
ncbi:MAG: hypothetical protein DRO99_02530 [Candidatus Aenigmatarchaeota archaeon]|nr:MAG: hypothetical protein DRO99_02530 [Candidatus Aenigmarchaeota archaeon]